MATNQSLDIGGTDLTARLIGIGMAFTGKGFTDPAIEGALADASVAGMDGGDFRVLDVLVTWLGIHSEYINADRLVRTVVAHSSPRVRAFWQAFAWWKHADRRFARLARADGEGISAAIDLLPTGNAFQIARRGEDERFAGSLLRVPAGTLRGRAGDVLGPADLARQHAGYRNRVLMGPTWRADVWTVLQATPGLPISEVARRAGCAFATAWTVARDFRVLHGAATEDARPSSRKT